MLATISRDDIRAQQQVDELLRREGIRRDRNLDYTCGIFDDAGNLIATGSCFGNTLRCFAVSNEHQGEGLLNQVLGHLMEVQVARGNTHVFLYTKPRNVKFFEDLGFYEIAAVDGTLVFMENRRNGFASYLARFGKNRSATPSAAVVMNANPFTRGHRYLVERAAADFGRVHLFILSENAGPIPAQVRGKLAREGVADLPNVVCHDSGPYIISAATFPSYFLKDEDAAIQAHAALDLTLFARIADALGVTCRYVGEEPTSHVTALYNQIMAEKLPTLGIRCKMIPRLEIGGRIVSASTVRQAIHDGNLEGIADMLPETTLRYFRSPEAAPVIAAICVSDDVIHY